MKISKIDDLVGIFNSLLKEVDNLINKTKKKYQKLEGLFWIIQFYWKFHFKRLRSKYFFVFLNIENIERLQIHIMMQNKQK